MKVIKWTFLLASLLVSSALYAVESGNVALTHFESLQRLDIQSARADEAARKLEAAASVALSFDALGRTFNLQLEPNNRLMSASTADGITAYRGRLSGNPDSWARIVVYNGVPSGLIWDGAEMFAVEAPGDSLLTISEPIIYRFADALIAPGTMTCAAGSPETSGSMSLQKLVGELGIVEAQAPGAISELTMGAVGDFEFTNNKGGDAAARAAITARLNNVDGIFSEQLGVQINVQVVDTFDTAADPFSDTLDASTLLDELSLYRSTTASQNMHGLTHLYTGRRFATSTVGIAWNGALCNDYFGAGVSEGNAGPTFDSLIAAHEIGHNFGAPHDGEPGSACASETGAYIMAPSINGVDQFSACSIEQMQDDVRRASCIAAIPAVDMSVRLTNRSATLLLGADTEFEYALANNGTLEATGVAAEFILPANFALASVTVSAGSCISGAGTISCDIGVVAGSSNVSVTIAGVPSATGVGTLSASISSDVDERLTNNQDALQFRVDPAVDLVVNAPTSNAVLVNSITTVNAVLENQSDLDASNVTLSVSLSNGLQASTANWSIGTCTVTPQQVDCQAAGFAARASSAFSIDVRGISAGNKNFTVDLSSLEAEANPGNNSVSASVRVNEPVEKNEGGGATAPIFLFLLSLSAVVGTRRSKRTLK